jgi:hypothetical protein
MGIGELNRLTTSLIDRPEEMLAETVKYCDAFFFPFQVPEELVRLMEDVKKLNPQTVLEIGTHRGGTLPLGSSGPARCNSGQHRFAGRQVWRRLFAFSRSHLPAIRAGSSEAALGEGQLSP